MSRGKKLAALLTTRAGTNPHIMGEVAQNLDALEVLNPALAARVRAQEPAAIAEAYESLFRYSKPLESSRGRRQLREVSPALADDLDTADHPQVIRAAEALARQDAFIPPDSLTISEGARMSKAKKAASVMGDVARGADKAPDIRRLIGELVGADAVDFTNPEVMRLLPANLQRGVLAGDTQAIAFATQHVLRSGNQRGRAAVDALGGAVPPRAPVEPAPTMDLDTAAYPVDVVGPPAGRPHQVGRSPHQDNIGAGSMDMRSPTQMPRSADLMPKEGLRPVAADFDPAPTIFDDSRVFAGPPSQGGVDLDDPALARFLETIDAPPRQPAGVPPRRPPPVGGGSPPRRPPPPSGPPRRPPPSPNGNAGRRAAGIGAGVLVGAAGARLAMEPNSLGDGEAGLPDADMAEPADDPMATADLAAEQTPPPQVEVREEPLDAREQAHALTKELNMRRRQAGGEIPEAPQMIRQIETLLAQADDAGNARMRQTMDGGPPSAAGPQDYHGQARDLIAQVNMMYRQGMTPNSPEAQRVMQEVRRLQSMGDAQRNAGTTAFPGRR